MKKKTKFTGVVQVIPEKRQKDIILPVRNINQFKIYTQITKIKKLIYNNKKINFYKTILILNMNYFSNFFFYINHINFIVIFSAHI